MNPPSPPKNGNKGKKKSKKLDIPLLDPETSLHQSDCKPLLWAVLLRKNYIWGRRVTSARTALIHSSIGFRLKGGVGSTSNKTVRSEKTLREASCWKNLNKGIDYKSISWKSHSDQCTVFIPFSICLQGRSPHLFFATRIQNSAFKHPAINCHRKLKALNTEL